MLIFPTGFSPGTDFIFGSKNQNTVNVTKINLDDGNCTNKYERKEQSGILEKVPKRKITQIGL